MRTNKVVIDKVKDWMSKNDKSHQWLADELKVSKSLVGHMLAGKRTLKPQRIIELASLMETSVEELTKDPSFKEERLLVQLRGGLSNRRSKSELNALLFAIEDYIGLKN